VEVLHDRGPATPVGLDRWTGASGYLIGGRMVLTAAHAVDYRHDLGDDEQVLVRSVDGSEFPAQVLLVCDESSRVDLALLKISASQFSWTLPPIFFARIDRDSPAPMPGCWAVGFPRFGEAGPVLPSGSCRETWQVRGDILPGGKLRSGLLSLQVTSTPQTSPASLAGSAWEGMSGAVVFVTDPHDGDQAVGVVTTHHRAEGESALTVVPITAVSGLLTKAQWWQQLGVSDPDALPVLPRQQRPGQPGRALRGYLEAARRAAREHPYSIALLNAPSLATVYLRQQLAVPAEDDKDRERNRTSRAEPGPSQRTAVPATQSLSIEDALLRHRCVVVLGGPGAGKSSLLRHLTDVVATSWLDADGQRYVPVRISADALTGNHPFPDIITASVMEDLGATIGELPHALFASEALPGIPWLILVDGLDEITSREMRDKATRVLIHWWNNPAYRFLVASRQLPEDQLAPLRAVASVFTIEPFAPGQLPDLATRWFAALKVDDVAGTAKRFLDHLEQSRLGEIATTLLIATLACVVFASNQAVPPSRFDLYDRFVARLLEDPRKRESLLQHLEGQARPYAAEDSIRKLVQDRRPLLEHYAYIRQLGIEGAGITESFQELFAAWTQRYKPDSIPIQRWSELVMETARQSGLLVQRGDDFVFFHQTIQEYLSACYQATTFRPSRRRATKELSLWTGRVWDGEWDDMPTPQLFLAVAWMNRTGRPPRPIPSPLPYHRVVYGMFLGALAHDGVSLSSSTAKRAIGQLTRITHAPWWARWWMRAGKAARLPDRWFGIFAWTYIRIAAAKGLVRLDREQGIVALGTLAADSSLTANQADDARIDAAITLASLDRTRGADALGALAADTAFGYGYRPEAVQNLTEIDPERARQILAELCVNPNISDWDRQNAAIDLNLLNNNHDNIALAAMATECTVTRYARARAAATLAKEGSELAIETVAAYMADTTVDSWDRVDAAEALSAIAPGRVADMLAAFTVDPTAQSYPRLLAARLLSQTNVERGTQALEVIANDPKADSDDRRWAAENIADLDRPRGIQKLANLASDPSMKRRERRRARRAVRKLRRQRDAS
jgi:hypothetical protein